MDINGTVTITLKDYEHLKKLAEKGRDRLAIHQDLLHRTSQCVTAIVYDPSLSSESAQKVIAHVRTLSNSLPEINFYSDTKNNKIILGLPDDE